MRTWGLLAAAGARCSGFVLPHTRFASSLAMSNDFGPGSRLDQGQQRGSDERYAYAYCHGFLSSPASVKGLALRKSMLAAGVDLSLLNLNGPGNDPGAISCSGALEAVRTFHLEKKTASGDPGLKLRLVGSSLGGFIVARYAELYPAEVDRIFMLCPSFGLGTRAQNFDSETGMAEWEQTGTRVFPLSTGGEASVPWEFVREAKLQPDYPAYLCPAEIVHGLHDDVVPVTVTRSLVEGSRDLARRTFVTFVEDDHALTQPSTMALTAKALAEFFDVAKKESKEVAGFAAVVEGSAEKSRQPPPQEDIEVEDKFRADNVEKIKEAVLARGGKLIGEQVFTDVYWDTKECGLMERDWWLRSRAGRWELKMPAANVGEGATAYREVTVASAIATELREAGFLGTPEAPALQELHLNEQALEAAEFEAFASFRTNREKIGLEGFTVDIDQASFGHRVVEIEKMTSQNKSDIASARDSISRLARSLGVQREGESGSPVKGKLVEYIIRNCPRQMEVLTRQRASWRGDGK
ncbi:unnamed protein product [Scytosiphon promiscuus]